jgi:DtxR family Mn-dependent transcriptional regulator
MNDLKILTKKERDCLMTIGQDYNSEFPIRLIDLSEKLNIKSPTALNLINRLAEKKIVNHQKGMIILTEIGLSFYREISENHRILETLMVNFGMDIEKACILSENVDYLIDHKSIDKMFDKLGKPNRCPHGRLIEQFHT